MTLRYFSSNTSSVSCIYFTLWNYMNLISILTNILIYLYAYVLHPFDIVFIILLLLLFRSRQRSATKTIFHFSTCKTRGCSSALFKRGILLRQFFSYISRLYNKFIYFLMNWKELNFSSFASREIIYFN